MKTAHVEGRIAARYNSLGSRATGSARVSTFFSFCDRVRWEDVDLERRIVTIDAAASKVRQRRIVHLQPAATAWLTLARRLGSELPLPSVTRRRHLRDVRDKLGFKEWPKDVRRHSCASHLMASWQDVPHVAAELGNFVDILMRYCRELVREEDAERFWRLIPRRGAGRAVDTVSSSDTITS